ncbi:hypothetical protein Bbelb_100930 [Branchiostoma belcheri]|nr:hypothetical protein Bbelb_100930 [Branchiostoma belcheri]
MAEISLDKVKILDTEPDFFARGIKEAIYTRALQPSLNRDGGHHRLSATYDPLLTESRTFCGRVQDAVRDFPRESAGRPPGECDTFCGRVRYVQRESANIARRFPGEGRGLACPTVFEDWTGSGCNIKGAGGFC